VVRPGALGDTIISLPAVRALRRAVGVGGEVDWVGYPRYLRVALNPLHASATYSVDRALFTGLFSDPVSPDLDRFLSSYDLVVLWCRDGAGHLRRLMNRLRVPYIQSAPFPASGSKIHASERLLLCLERPLNDAPNDTINPELVLSREAQATGDGLLRTLGVQVGNFLAVHPGSGDFRKNWSPLNFSRVARLARESGLELLIIEGDADEEPVREMLGYMKHRPAILHEEDLQVVARVLSRAAVYVGNDSGISHLAAAAGALTIALFGPTDPRNWAPRGRSVHILPLSATAQWVWSTIQSVCRKPPKVNPCTSL
jgi:hypothetical protein